MPSLKRASESYDSESPDNTDSESAASPSQPHSVRVYPSSHRKRPRPSPSPSEDDVSDHNTTPLADDALLDESTLELHQTQILQDKYSHVIDEANVPAEHGILERVDCYNFMCHDHFSVELGPLINFIVGKNGSGKSAILTALTLCLGGKASDTNRGQSLKSFIKQGKESSTIVVRIKNQGEAAYMPAEFGKSIIIERHFTKSGSSGFKIKSENGRIISTKKADLDAITDYFSLQIDNPMNVLSQDMARQFLSSSSPLEKYKFFVKGVQLEQLDQDYRVIEDFVDQMEEKSRSQAQDIRILEHQRNFARKKLEASDKHNSLRERVRNLRHQMAWAQVEEQERIRESIAQEVIKGNNEVARAESALSSFDTRLEHIEHESETAAEHALQADRIVEEARGDKEEQKQQSELKQKEHGNLLAQEREIRKALENAEQQRDKHQQAIDAENQRLAEMSNGSHARKQTEYEEAKQSADDARRVWDEYRTGKARLVEDRQQALNEEAAAKRQVDEKEMEVKQAEDRLHSLRRENGSRQTGFPAKMPKAKWACIVEHSVGNNLSGFIVDSKRDQGILLNIMHRVDCVCPIFIGRGGEIDTSSNEPDTRYATTLRILQFDNPEVQRLLVIQNSIDQTLLIENLDEAFSVLYDGPRLRNVKRCFCIDAKDRRRGVMLTYNKSGDPSQGPVPIQKGHPRVKSDAASQIRSQEEVVQDLKGHLKELKQDLETARSRVEACKREIAAHDGRERELKLEMQQKEDERERLREALENGNEASQIDMLQNLLANTEGEIETHRGSLNDCQAAKAEIIQELKLLRRGLGAQDQKITELEQNARVAESERSRVDARKHEIITEKNSAIAMIQQRQAEVRRLQEKWQKSTERVQEFTTKAELVSTRRVPIDEGETPTSLDTKLERLQRDLNNYNAQLGASREEIAAEAARTETIYQQAVAQIEETGHLVDYFKQTLQNRKRRWEIFRAHISSRAKAQFTYLLSERSFRGYLLLDHTNRRLDLQVEPDITKHDGTAMGSPIRCLDEFDVYMDHINRKMSIEMLLLAARRSIGRQFILITPGTRSDIKIGPDVHVKELSDPERGQTTLPFQRG
ncbi:hypothetical protein N7470_006746 [Penicillium chermesinum]|nr:hypothetical protein N7470_006746 [Penicillium chermesinum]